MGNASHLNACASCTWPPPGATTCWAVRGPCFPACRPLSGPGSRPVFGRPSPAGWTRTTGSGTRCRSGRTSTAAPQATALCGMCSTSLRSRVSRTASSRGLRFSARGVCARCSRTGDAVRPPVRIVGVLDRLPVDRTVAPGRGIRIEPLPTVSDDLPPWLPDKPGLMDFAYLGRTLVSVEAEAAPALFHPENPTARTGAVRMTLNADLNVDDVCKALSLLCAASHARRSSGTTTATWSHSGGARMAGSGPEQASSA